MLLRIWHNCKVYRKMRYLIDNFAVQLYQPGRGIGQMRFILDGKCPGRDIAGSNPARAAILGIALTLRDSCISLYNYIEYNDYEDYYVVPTADGGLAVSHVIWGQDPYCANDVFNIFTEKSVDKGDILTTH